MEVRSNNFETVIDMNPHLKNLLGSGDSDRLPTSYSEFLDDKLIPYTKRTQYLHKMELILTAKTAKNTFELEEKLHKLRTSFGRMVRGMP
jgi:hypothetical protein